MSFENRLDELHRRVGELPGAIVAFSGGVDSAFLSEVAHRRLGDRFIAVTADSASLPRRELLDCIGLAHSRGWKHIVVPTDELSSSDYAANPTNRCYFCKVELFTALAPLATETGFPVLLGTNADDIGDHRPGQVAADEAGALHPMLDVGLTKQDIRRASDLLGLATSAKPASACLASRFAYGVGITREGLARVEGAEEYLREAGLRVLRVRDLGNDRARVEVGKDELDLLKASSFEIQTALLNMGFGEVTLDEEGYRRGSLNEGIVTIALGAPRSERSQAEVD
ncbi:MAG: ATP-dependent sacrificial sulfur transferase LarE [Actinomycetota bacterium]|nr:ATP-dependent sacrificial sulfur transferase LarE [Actinomycetota bacterium]